MGLEDYLLTIYDVYALSSLANATAAEVEDRLLSLYTISNSGDGGGQTIGEVELKGLASLDVVSLYNVVVTYLYGAVFLKVVSHLGRSSLTIGPFFVNVVVALSLETLYATIRPC